MYQEFIANYKVFDSDAMSKECRESMIRTLQGLGLPIPIGYSKRVPWGYARQERIDIPVEQDLQVFLKALEMINSKQYLLPDVWEWFNSAPITRKLSFRAFKYLRADRPAFSEMKLSPQERINLVYRPTSVTAQEICSA